MTSMTVDALEQLRLHFNKAPYPNIPLEEIPTDPDRLYIHSLVTAYYRRNHKVIKPAGRVILDAGCGTGYKSLELAIANPGARIVGVDISEDSVVMARQRMAYHKVDNCEFHALPVERLAELGMKFDYINCDDVLYLVPDAVVALAAMQSVLQPEGILRVNYHSETGRNTYIRAQRLFRRLGCMTGPPDSEEVELVRQTMQAFKTNVTLVTSTWNQDFMEREEAVLANHLLQNDKSWSVPKLFEALRAGELEFFSMVNWWTWNLMDLFQDVEELPLEVVMRLSEMAEEERLAIYEDVHASHRLLDLWAGKPGQTHDFLPIEDWSETNWYQAKVFLHPQLLSDRFKDSLRDCAEKTKMLNTDGFLATTTPQPATLFIDNLMAGCLLPLLDGEGRKFEDLVNRWLHLHPINPVTMEPSTPAEAFFPLQQILMELEKMGYVMLEAA
jgi:ubiquinone/menaquinone biosynthesis C-methylase UbiE